MPATIEEYIVAMNKRGWRVSNLSFIGQRQGYSLIVEKDASGTRGMMFAFNRHELDPTPLAAFQSCWDNLLKDLDSPRVIEKGVTPTKRGEKEPTLEGVLKDSAWLRMQLEEGVRALIKSLTGAEDGDDDFL